MSKILTVFGATGLQGGSVVDAVLAHHALSKEYKIKGVTRDPSKASGQALAAKHVEPIKADMNDPASLRAALKGSYAVFAVTNFWETRSQETEVKQGKNIADACKAEGVKHLIFSTLPYVTKLTEGVYTHVDHFDGKAQVTEYIESIKGDDMVATYFMPGFYASNIKSNVRPDKDGVPTLSLPWDPEKTHVGVFAAGEDTGKFVSGILAQNPANLNGKSIHAVSEWVTPAQIVATISKEAGRHVKFTQLTKEVYYSFLPKGLEEELGETMLLIRDYSYYGRGAEKQQAESDAVLPEGVKTTTWADFVKKTGPWQW